MLQHREHVITKMIRNFIWEESTSPRIALNHLHHTIEEGELNLIDIKTRNEGNRNNMAEDIPEHVTNKTNLGKNNRHHSRHIGTTRISCTSTTQCIPTNMEHPSKRRVSRETPVRHSKNDEVCSRLQHEFCRITTITEAQTKITLLVPERCRLLAN